jgi:putative ABC transport system substrate-binding protein
MNRKVLGLLTVLILVLFQIAKAQQPTKIPRIGYLHSGSAPTPPDSLKAFRQGLRDLGYIEGKNIIIEYRFAEYKPERIPELAAELVGLNVDLIVTSQTPNVQAIQKVSSTIPIVFGVLSFPIENGIITSFAHPGKNATGLTVLSEELNGKRLALLKEVAPKTVRVGVFSNLDNPTQPLEWREIQSAAQGLGLKLQSLGVRSANDFDATFRAALTGRSQALINLPEALVNANFKRIAAFAAKHRMPAIYSDRSAIDVNGLMFYGPNGLDLWRRAATYVDKILKGAKPADLPVQQATKFEFVINLKAAKQIGLTIPPRVLERANKVIKERRQ